MCIEVIVCNISVIFLRHSVVSKRLIKLYDNIISALLDHFKCTYRYKLLFLIAFSAMMLLVGHRENHPMLIDEMLSCLSVSIEL